jgi:hypothetical protein
MTRPHDLLRASDKLKGFTKPFVLSPKNWKRLALPVTLNWKTIAFSKGNIAKLPEEAGVYTFVVKPNIAGHPECSYLMYVGETKDQTLRKRFSQYVQEQKQTEKSRPFVWEMLNRWSKHLVFCYATVADTSLIRKIEDGLIEAFLPPVNSELPAAIRKPVRLARGF